MAYIPESPPEIKDANGQMLIDYLFRELNRLGTALKNVNLEQTFVAPTRPQDGDVIYADGTSWNPGGGKGMYGYIGGAWVKLG